MEPNIFNENNMK